jgi:hypothetical protein
MLPHLDLKRNSIPVHALLCRENDGRNALRGCERMVGTEYRGLFKLSTATSEAGDSSWEFYSSFDPLHLCRIESLL